MLLNTIPQPMSDLQIFSVPKGPNRKNSACMLRCISLKHKGTSQATEGFSNSKEPNIWGGGGGEGGGHAACLDLFNVH